MDTARPDALLAELRASHARLEAEIAGLDDETARADSALPGWTVGHVLTHVSRNADALAWLVAASSLSAPGSGEIFDQYPAGQAQRNADIEAGAGRPAAVLVADVVSAQRRLDALFALAPEHLWTHARARSGGGFILPFAEVAVRRLCESEIHRTDLGSSVRAGLDWNDWPDTFADTVLGEGPALGADGWLAAYSASDRPEGECWEIVAADRPGRWVAGDGATTVTIEGTRKQLVAWLVGRAERP